MNINIDNYETFFLLYADNELSAEERKAVQLFVSRHEDLREEFLQVQNTILPVEDIIYSDKNFLYKSQLIESVIQERLLLHMDGELKDEALVEIKELIATNHTIESEWEILQKTKLDSNESVIYPYKSSLYREQAKIIPARLTRLLIAAAFIGAGIFIGVRLQKIDTPYISSVEKPIDNNVTITDSKIHPNQNKAKIQLDQNGRDGDNSEYKKPNMAHNKIPVSASRMKDNVPVNDQKIKERLLITNQDAPIEEDQLITANKKNIKTEKLISAQPVNEIDSIQINESRPVLEPSLDNNIATINNSFAMPAVLDNTIETGNGNTILYMNEENLNRSKAGAFIRKVKRVVERNTRIKTGENLRIGGFEIAIK